MKEVTTSASARALSAIFQDEILSPRKEFTSALRAALHIASNIHLFYLPPSSLHSIIRRQRLRCPTTLTPLPLFCSLSFQRTTTVSARPWTHTISTSPPSESRFSSPFATVSSPSARSLVSKWLSGEGACRRRKETGMAWMGPRLSHVQQRLLKFCTPRNAIRGEGGDSRPLWPAAKRLKGAQCRQ